MGMSFVSDMDIMHRIWQFSYIVSLGHVCFLGKRSRKRKLEGKNK